MERREWYPLDNAANIYPVIRNRDWMPMFRLVAVLCSPVDVDVLQAALDALRLRFPGFYVTLKRGMFWYYLEHNPRPAIVEPDTLYICPPPGPDDLLFRVKVHENRIALEISHIIADGSGSMAFFKTLLAQYVRLLGVEVPCTHGILDITEPSAPEEWEDSFLRYFRPGRRPARRETYAYHPTGTRLPAGMQYITTGTLSVTQLLAVSRKHKASMTEYLAATLIYVLYRMQLSENAHGLKPVKVSIPVNLRKYYPTRTLRNFSQYLNPGIDPGLGDFTFEETLTQVHHYFRYMFTEKNLNARMSQNVDAEKNLALRLVPLFVKKAALRLAFELVGERVFSSVISNMGAMDLPEAMLPFIDRVDLLLCTARRNAVECGVASYRDTLSISFTRYIAEPYVERMFFQALVRQGLHVLVESNQISDE